MGQLSSFPRIIWKVSRQFNIYIIWLLRFDFDVVRCLGKWPDDWTFISYGCRAMTSTKACTKMCCSTSWALGAAGDLLPKARQRTRLLSVSFLFHASGKESHSQAGSTMRTTCIHRGSSQAWLEVGLRLNNWANYIGTDDHWTPHFHILWRLPLLFK